MGVQLPVGQDVDARTRLNVIRFLRETVGMDAHVARSIESEIHSTAADESLYYDEVKRCAMNIRAREENASEGISFRSDEELARGTLLETVRENERNRRAKFEQMLQVKYESLATDEEYGTSLRCRRCKSTDVAWEQRQTRSADEGATSYCMCAKCHLRWTIR